MANNNKNQNKHKSNLAFVFVSSLNKFHSIPLCLCCSCTEAAFLQHLFARYVQPDAVDCGLAEIDVQEPAAL